MSSSDDPPDYPVNSDLVRRLKAALDANDEGSLRELIGREVEPVDAVIELANDDWMKDPSAQLPSGVLLGDLDHIQPLMDQFFQDANIVFEISKDEMEWQVKSPATFGLSGLWTLEYKRELTTPLCIAAAHGHTACVRHLLSRGAHPDASPGGRGPLHEACLGDHTACARLLLQHGADPDLPSSEGLAPLHLCRTTASLGCAQALLEHGASVQLPGGAGRDTPLHVAAQHGLDEHGASPLARVLQTAACAPQAAPQLTVQTLLNHGSPTVWPDAFPKVLRTCAPAPGVIEVLFNSYAQLHVSESWKEMIPEEVYQMHEPFYQSFFALAHTPRCLQHLCRCAIRRWSGKNCFHLIPLLPLPKSLQDYLLLEPEGVLH
ncbi:ankyrin repeat and SOCS box protein 18 [Marmota marmota marmota]|uniref:ankyrin repeat and SOCS box protein 18 n=1 Tax=Marmota marmota marmota TaxID=9994 RepID=UPI00209222D6|nr:ankyrin repeat and SOCS box protein 18 [Marmota marmota marmota]